MGNFIYFFALRRFAKNFPALLHEKYSDSWSTFRCLSYYSIKISHNYECSLERPWDSEWKGLDLFRESNVLISLSSWSSHSVLCLLIREKTCQ